MRARLLFLSLAVAAGAFVALPSLLQPSASRASAQPANTPAASAQPADTPAAPTAVGSSGGLVIAGVAVDVRGRTPSEARMNGWRQAERLAWPGLWARMSGQPAGNAPALSDSDLDNIVAAIEVDHEEVGPGRYVATLSVVFDRLRAASFLGRFANVVASPPYLLIPVLQDAGSRSAYEPGSPWLAAWMRLRSGETPVDYVRIQPTPGDTILLSAWQTERRNLGLWRMLIDRYQVADVLVPELIVDRSWGGGPLSALLIVREGTAGKELGRQSLRNREGDLAALADAAVRAADRIYATALRQGKLTPNPALMPLDAGLDDLEDSGPLLGGGSGPGGVGTLDVQVATPDDQTLRAIERDLQQVPGVSGIDVKSFVLGGDSVLSLHSALLADELRYALDQHGLRLEGGQLRRRAAGEAPLSPPATEGEVGIVETTIPAPAAGGGQ